MKSIKNIKNTILILFATATAMALIGAGALFFGLNFEFNSEIHHFTKGALSPVISAVCLCIALAGAVVAYTVSGKNVSLNNRKNPHFLTAFASSLMGCTAALSAVTSFMTGAPESKAVVFYVKTALTLLCALYFLAKAFGADDKIPAFDFISLVPSVMLAFSILYSYFDPDSSMNSASKTFLIVMMVAFMLYFKNIAGVSVARPTTARKLIFSGIISVSCGSVAIARFAGAFMHENALSLSISETSLHLAIWVYIFIDFLNTVLSVTKTAEVEEPAAEDIEENEEASEENETNTPDETETEPETEEAEEEDNEDKFSVSKFEEKLEEERENDNFLDDDFLKQLEELEQENSDNDEENDTDNIVIEIAKPQVKKSKSTEGDTFKSTKKTPSDVSEFSLRSVEKKEVPEKEETFTISEDTLKRTEEDNNFIEK